MRFKTEGNSSITIDGADRVFLEDLVEKTKNIAIIIGGPYDGKIIEGTTEKLTNRNLNIEYQRKLWRVKDNKTGVELPILVYHNGDLENCVLNMSFKLGLFENTHQSKK